MPWIQQFQSLQQDLGIRALAKLLSEQRCKTPFSWKRPAQIFLTSLIAFIFSGLLTFETHAQFTGQFDPNSLVVTTGTTATNGPYAAGAKTITVSSLVAVSVGQTITLTLDDASQQNVTVTSVGNSQLGPVVNFTPGINSGRSLPNGNAVSFAQTLAVVAAPYPPYYPTGFGTIPTGHQIPWLDNDWNVFTGNQLGLKSADYSINGNITSFMNAPAMGDTTTVVMATGAAILTAPASSGATSITVASAINLATAGLVGQSVTIGGASRIVKSVSGAASPYTLTLASGLPSAAAAGALALLPINGAFSAQVATVPTATSANPSSVVVTSSIVIPAGQTIFMLTTTPTTVSATVSSMTPSAGCNPGGAPCAMTITFTGAITGTLAAGTAIWWNYSYSDSYAAVGGDTMNTVLRTVANRINANSSLSAAGVQAVLQGVGTTDGLLIVEPKRLGKNLNFSIAVFESPAGSGHLRVSSYSQPVDNLDASAILTLSRNAAGYPAVAGDAVGFIQFSGISNGSDPTYPCCTAQYSSIISYIGNPATGSSLRGITAFLTAGSQGVNRRMDISKGLTLYDDNNTAAAGGDIAGSINVPSTGSYNIGGSDSSLLVSGTVLTLHSTVGLKLDAPTTKSCSSGILSDAVGNIACIVSSMRFKDGIKSLSSSDQVVSELRPVKFTYKESFRPQDTREHMGLIAEEVAKVAPACASPDGEGKPFTVDYNCITALLLAKVQKQERDLEELRNAVYRKTRPINRVRHSGVNAPER